MSDCLRAPFPYFGGKSKAAHLVWAGLGDVRNYVEPFFGSGAVLLARPHPGRMETANDSDGLLTNFWRAVRESPAEVARFADGPENEIELRARHAALLKAKPSLVDALTANPDWHDPRLAGWWAWVASANAIPRKLFTQSASLVARGGSHAGVCSIRKGAGALASALAELSDRVRLVRTLCGDWSRCVQSSSMMGGAGLTGVFLDPPYLGTDAAYDTSGGVERDVWQWAVESGDSPSLRICVAGYDDGRDVPEGWRTVEWKAGGGYGNKADGEGRANASRERLWFSPHCIDTTQQMSLL